MSLASRVSDLATAVGQEIKSVRTELAGKSNVGHTHTASEISGLPGGGQAFVAAQWYHPIGLSGASNNMAAGQLRVFPWVLDKTLSIDRIGIAATAAGTAASVRFGIYSDSNGYPNSLLFGSGVFTVTVSNMVATVSPTLVLNPGIVWIGVALNAATTAPTLDLAGAGWFPPRVTQRLGTTQIGAGNIQGVQTTGVTGALPATFPAGGTNALLVPRVTVRAA